MSPHDHDQDRRQHFRIEDDAHVVVHEVSEEEYARVTENEEPPGTEECGLVAELHHLSSQAGIVMAKLRKSDPDVAHYLSLLDHKIDLVARMCESGRQQDLKPNARINLSANGVGLRRAEPMTEGAKVEIRLVFFPSYLCIHAYGEVAHCREAEDADAGRPYEVGVEFTVMREMEREALIKHTLERQSALLRQQRGRE